MDDGQVPTERTLMEVLAELTEAASGPTCSSPRMPGCAAGRAIRTPQPPTSTWTGSSGSRVSDPADMAAVLGLTCRHCGTKGYRGRPLRPRGRPPGRRGPRRPRGPPLLTPPQLVPVGQHGAVRGTSFGLRCGSRSRAVPEPGIVPVGARAGGAQVRGCRGTTLRVGCARWTGGGPSGWGGGSRRTGDRPARRARTVASDSRSSGERPPARQGRASVVGLDVGVQIVAGRRDVPVGADSPRRPRLSAAASQASSSQPRAGWVTTRGAPPTAAARTWAAHPSMPAASGRRCGRRPGAPDRGEPVPQRRQRLLGPRQTGVGAVERAAVRTDPRCPAADLPRGLGDRWLVSHRTEHVAQGGGGGHVQGRETEGVGGGAHRPDRRQGPGHHAGIEVEEGRR